MSSLDSVVRVDISLETTAVSEDVFDVPLLLSASSSGTWTTSELTRVYADAEEVGVDFAASTPEYLAASAYFAQDPKPASLIIGRLSDDPAMTYDVGVVTVANSTAYKFLEGSTLISYTSDSSATNDEIADGLAAAVTSAAISGVSAASTGSVGSKVCTVTGTAGTFLAPSLYDSSAVAYGPDGLGRLSLAMTTAEPSTAMATQIANIQAENDGWAAILSPYVGKPIDTAIAAKCESIKRLFFQADQSTKAITTAVAGAADLADALHTLSRNWSAVLYAERPLEFAAAAWVGSRLSLSPGTENWAFAQLSGVTPSKLSSTHVTNLQNKQANFYTQPGGVKMTRWGTCASGQYIDVVRLAALIDSRIVAAIATRMTQGKIPGTQAGIQILFGVVYGVLEGLRTQPLPALDSFTLSEPLQRDRSVSDKAARLLTGLDFTAVPTGAIDKIIPIIGTVSL